MKRTTFAFIAMLLAIILALFSACNSTVPPIQPGEGISSPTEDTSFDESVPEESSEPPIETDVSANMSDLVDIPPLGTPSKLIPIVEFGFGDGDYELGYSEPDEYGFTRGPQGMWINGNEILINDHVNRRLLVYRDGKLIDKVDISDYPFALNCAITDDYYYVIDKFGSAAYRIDRKTKEFEEIDFEAHDCSQDNDYAWNFTFVKNGGNVYIRGNHYGADDDVCYLIDGAKASDATISSNPSIVRYENGKYIVDGSNSQPKELTLIPQVNGISATTSIVSRKNGSASIIYQNMEYRDAEKKLSTYYVYYKLSSDGTVIGRYIQFMSNHSYTPPCYAALNSSNFEKAITKNGDLLVVNGDDKHVGIYRVEFGMDEIPFDVSDEDTDTQGDLHYVQSPISDEVNALSSEDMTYHPRVTREQAKQRALQMINLTWELTQANKQKPAGCTHSLSIPDHVLKAPVETTMTGIPYCVSGGNGLEYLQGASAVRDINFDEAMRFGKVAGNVSGFICSHAAGLDCSGYASSVYNLQHKYYSKDFVNAGINLGACENYPDLDTVLDRMDLFVQISSKNHIFLFIEQTEEYADVVNDSGETEQEVIKIVHYYNCTQNYGNTTNTPINMTVKYSIDKKYLDAKKSDLTLHKMWNCTDIVTYSDNNFHKSIRSCGVCDTTTYYIPHAVAGYSSYNGLYHSGTCRFCSGQVIEAHKYSSTTGPCTICGYNGPRPVNPNLNKDKALSGQDIAVAE